MKPSSQDTDENLMQRYRMGDFDAFEELYARHARKVYGFLRKKLPLSAVDDAFQEVWMKLHRSRNNYDMSLPFIPWIFTLARNTMIDRIRNLQHRAEVPVNDEYVSPQASTAGLPVYADLVGPLSSTEQQVIDMHYKWGLSFDEIAERLKMKPAAARKTSSRAIQRLRSIFGAKSSK